MPPRIWYVFLQDGRCAGVVVLLSYFSGLYLGGEIGSGIMVGHASLGLPSTALLFWG